MKTSILLFVGSLVLAVSGYVGSHNDITTFAELFGNVQNFFGMLGVIGGVLVGWVSKSPIPSGESLVQKVTGNGSQKLP